MAHVDERDSLLPPAAFNPEWTELSPNKVFTDPLVALQKQRAWERHPRPTTSADGKPRLVWKRLETKEPEQGPEQVPEQERLDAPRPAINEDFQHLVQPRSPAKIIKKVCLEGSGMDGHMRQGMARQWDRKGTELPRMKIDSSPFAYGSLQTQNIDKVRQPGEPLHHDDTAEEPSPQSINLERGDTKECTLFPYQNQIFSYVSSLNQHQLMNEIPQVELTSKGEARDLPETSMSMLSSTASVPTVFTHESGVSESPDHLTQTRIADDWSSGPTSHKQMSVLPDPRRTILCELPNKSSGDSTCPTPDPGTSTEGVDEVIDVMDDVLAPSFTSEMESRIDVGEEDARTTPTRLRASPTLCLSSPVLEEDVVHNPDESLITSPTTPLSQPHAASAADGGLVSYSTIGSKCCPMSDDVGGLDQGSTTNESTANIQSQQQALQLSPVLAAPEDNDSLYRAAWADFDHAVESTSSAKRFPSEESLLDVEDEFPLDEVEHLAKEHANGTSVTEDAKVMVNFNDDTDILMEFLNRARASKAARIAKRSSISYRRDSDAVKCALASPRKVLEELDANSPSPRKATPVPVGADNELSKLVLVPSKLANEVGIEENSPNEKDNVEEPHLITRRSTRSCLPATTRNVPPANPVNLVTVRRPDGQERLLLKRTEVQELGSVTRGNTRRNKGGALSARQMLLKLNSLPEDVHVEERSAETKLGRSTTGKKVNVRWKSDDELLHFFVEKPATFDTADIAEMQESVVLTEARPEEQITPIRMRPRRAARNPSAIPSVPHSIVDQLMPSTTKVMLPEQPTPSDEVARPKQPTLSDGVTHTKQTPTETADTAQKQQQQPQKRLGVSTPAKPRRKIPTPAKPKPASAEERTKDISDMVPERASPPPPKDQLEAAGRKRSAGAGSQAAPPVPAPPPAAGGPSVGRRSMVPRSRAAAGGRK